MRRYNLQTSFVNYTSIQFDEYKISFEIEGEKTHYTYINEERGKGDFCTVNFIEYTYTPLDSGPIEKTH